MSAVTRGAAIGSMIALLACSKAGEEASSKRAPVPPPPPSVELPADVSIPVEVDGKAAGEITTAQLASQDPDFVDEDRRAWRLDRLLPKALKEPGAVIEAVGADGMGITMRAAESKDGPQPVLFFTRRGDLIAAAVRPGDPFPNYHGRGGRLRRPGDPRPRLLTPVSRLVIHTGDHRVDGLAGLEVVLGDAPAAPLSRSQLATIPSASVQGDSGDRRQLWSLRDLARVVGGDDARVAQVVGATTAMIDEKAWASEKTPVLQANRRGALKFFWRDADGSERTEGAVRDVTSVRLTPSR